MQSKNPKKTISDSSLLKKPFKTISNFVFGYEVYHLNIKATSTKLFRFWKYALAGRFEFLLYILGEKTSWFFGCH